MGDYQLLASERSLKMTVDVMPGIGIDADRDLLLQSLHGLLENAIRYAKSRILVSCRMEDARAVLEIHNDRDPATIAPAGLGLGLRLIRGICKASAWEMDTRETEIDFHAVIHFHPEAMTAPSNA
jgi:signal transduction histidine kinase